MGCWRTPRPVRMAVVMGAVMTGGPTEPRAVATDCRSAQSAFYAPDDGIVLPAFVDWNGEGRPIAAGSP
jgi:hypothetical protein